MQRGRSCEPLHSTFNNSQLRNQPRMPLTYLCAFSRGEHFLVRWMDCFVKAMANIELVSLRSLMIPPAETQAQ